MRIITIALTVSFAIPDGHDPAQAVADFWEQEPDIFGDGYQTEPEPDGATCDGEVVA